MDKQPKLIDADKLLECLKKEAEFCIKEKFSERNTRFYLGRETVLTDIIRQIESGKFDLSDPIPTTIKQGDKVRHKDYPAQKGIVEDVFISAQVNFDDARVDYRLSNLEVSHD